MALHWLHLCFLPAFFLSFYPKAANGDVQQEVPALAIWRNSVYENHNVEKATQKRNLTTATGDAGGVQQEIAVPAIWRKAVYENDNVEKVIKKITFTKGMKNRHSDTRMLTATHNIGAVVAVGDLFKIAKLKLSYSFSHTNSNVTMRENEIYEQRTIEHTVTIPPKSTLTRWQLVAHVAGMQIDYNHYIDVINDTYTMPRTYSSIATLLHRRKIRYGETKIRIKHLEKQQYIIVVSRYHWPAATLELSKTFYFVLHKDTYAIRIETLNSMYPGYVWAYSSTNGGVYFDLDHNLGEDYYPKQYWSISEDPIYDGDSVTIRNKYFDDSGLCYYRGPNTDVYCMRHRHDKWILEVV